jgi:hypothetical protein
LTPTDTGLGIPVNDPDFQPHEGLRYQHEDRPVTLSSPFSSRQIAGAA